MKDGYPELSFPFPNGPCHQAFTGQRSDLYKTLSTGSPGSPTFPTQR